MGIEIWKHYPGYCEARLKVQSQSLEDDLKLLDDLFSRENLSYGATPEDVKAEAFRQLEIEWRDGTRNGLAEGFVAVAQSGMCFDRIDGSKDKQFY